MMNSDKTDNPTPNIKAFFILTAPSIRLDGD